MNCEIFVLYYLYFQIEGYDELHYCPQAASPNLTFVFQHEDTRPKKIFCKFRASQDACEFDNPVDITLSVHFEAEVIFCI